MCRLDTVTAVIAKLRLKAFMNFRLCEFVKYYAKKYKLSRKYYKPNIITKFIASVVKREKSSNKFYTKFLLIN